MTFVLYGETPSKKNSRVLNTRTRRSFPNKRYAEWHDHAVLQVRSQARGYKAPLPCSIVIKFWHGDKRIRDSDNMLSSILDMLIDSGILLDDRWEYVPHKEVFDFYERGKPRCEIMVEEQK